MSGHVFRRSTVPNPPVAVAARGSTIVDADGREYLDAAGGAVVVNVGHGRREIADALAEQAGRLSYAHGSAFTNEPLERYAAEVGEHLPVDDPYLYPVSGGSEAIESALKLARATQLARGEVGRRMVFARWGSYHGNTLGALATVEELAGELEAAIVEAGASNVAAFVGEPIVGATLGAVEPPEGYWPAIADVCRRHGVLLIADEVMTGFGRTGAWFGMDHYGVRPDMLVAAKGATSGYWPFGFVAVSGAVWDDVRRGGGFVHGFTYSHQPGAAAVAREVLRILEAESLVEASAVKGERLLGLLRARLGYHAAVGDIRGRGLLVGVELVRDRVSKAPYPRAAKLIEAVVRIARDRGLLLYSGTGNANGTDGDVVVLGPPFVVTDDELARIADGLGDALDTALAELRTLGR
jgi:adenosylmethionine-8-amino-7-oxononanoate aminotransferase